MLVMTRRREQSIVFSAPNGDCLFTVMGIRDGEVWVAIQTDRSTADGKLEARTASMRKNSVVRVSPHAEVTLLEVSEDRARFGTVAERKVSVHRLEMWRLLKDRGEDDEGSAPSPAPHPSGPKPPSLDVRREVPKSEEDSPD